MEQVEERRPTVFVMDSEDSINAFAAGKTPSDAVVGVTRGCMTLLTRDELQGVIAHEFSHILNGDMRLNMRLMGLLFGILFLAEWGDLSQILTASLVLKYQDPVSVFVGAFLALAAVSGLGAALGRVLLAKMRLSTLRRVGGIVCLIMATLSVLQLLGVIGG